MKVAHLISFGLAGHGIEITNTWRDGYRTKGSISGYDSPESFERALARGEKAEYPPLAGVPVLDKRPALRKSPALAIQSPLVDVELEDGTVERLEASTSVPESQLTAFDSSTGKPAWNGRFESSSAKVRTADRCGVSKARMSGSSSLPATTR